LRFLPLRSGRLLIIQETALRAAGWEVIRAKSGSTAAGPRRRP
jgi:hypothetical protein